MAKKEAAAASSSAAIVQDKPAGLALVDPLADILATTDELGVTGTEELGGSAVRLPALVFNTKHVPKGSQDPIPPTRFLNSMTEEVREKVSLQVVYDHKSRSWSHFDEKQAKRVVHCRSWDGITGRVVEGVPGHEPGDERPCANCPDYKWRRVDGKNTRNCGEVHNLVAIDRESGEVVMMPLRRTAIRGWLDFYQKNFYGKRAISQGPGKPVKRADLPLFAAITIVSLVLRRDGGMAWAEPEFTLGAILSREEILFGAETARGFLETKLAAVGDTAEQAEEQVRDGGADASFDFGANAKESATQNAPAAGRF